jgi:hypothetical protein
MVHLHLNTLNTSTVSGKLTLLRSMLRDEEVYPNPNIFNPDRFIKDGVLNREIRDPRDIVFGFGRRSVYFLSLHDACDLLIL